MTTSFRDPRAQLSWTVYTTRRCSDVVQGDLEQRVRALRSGRGPQKFALANFWGEQASRLGAQRSFRAPACERKEPARLRSEGQLRAAIGAASAAKPSVSEIAPALRVSQ